jgi:hypothetical protein
MAGLAEHRLDALGLETRVVEFGAQGSTPEAEAFIAKAANEGR